MNPSRLPFPVRQRFGITLVESVAALSLLAVLTAAVIPVLSRTSQLRRKVDQREVALNAISNLLERASLLNTWNDTTVQAQTVELVSPLDLPSPEWKVMVTQESSIPLQRVEVTLSWQQPAGMRGSVSLVRWFAEEQP